MNENDFKKFLEDNSWNYDKKTVEQMMEKELEKEPQNINTEFVDACMEYLTSYSENTVYEKERVTDDKKSKHKRIKLIRIVAAAAIAVISAATVTAFAIPSSREYVVAKFSNHSSYEVSDFEDAPDVKSLTVEYVPEGFKKVEEDNDSLGFTYVYENENKDTIVIDKYRIDTTIDYDTEYSNSYTIKENGITYVVYYDDTYTGVIWNNREFIYALSGNISEQEALKTAKSIK